MKIEKISSCHNWLLAAETARMATTAAISVTATVTLAPRAITIQYGHYSSCHGHCNYTGDRSHRNAYPGRHNQRIVFNDIDHNMRLTSTRHLQLEDCLRLARWSWLQPLPPWWLQFLSSFDNNDLVAEKYFKWLKQSFQLPKLPCWFPQQLFQPPKQPFHWPKQA